MSEQIYHRMQISEKYAGKRLDQALSAVFKQYSRSLIKKWLENNNITLNGAIPRARDKVIGGENVTIDAILEQKFSLETYPIDLNIFYEDDHIVVINKPSGLIVHPGAGNPNKTLMNGILHHYPKSAVIPRAGIVHRLDRDTSGLMVIAKSLESYYKLIEDIKERSIKREYEAIVHGRASYSKTIDEPIGRHTKNRTKMAVTPKGKPAISECEVIKKFTNHSHLRIKLVTGRTHQIRVHLTYIGHPIVGDLTYGDRNKKLNNMIKRQALHACSLTLPHPITRKIIEVKNNIPSDMQKLLDIIIKESDNPSKNYFTRKI